ncbi:hypothetical protein RK21_03343 [Pseudomonas plecoglossicida]|nr:hypothetical protein RK21_03343 [Pseudomonas plecoglossicida]
MHDLKGAANLWEWVYPRKGRHTPHKSQAKKNPAEAGFFMKLQTNYLAWAST